jgi:hypothetical protein
MRSTAWPDRIEAPHVPACDVVCPWIATLRVSVPWHRPWSLGGDARPKIALGPEGEICVKWTKPLSAAHESTAQSGAVDAQWLKVWLERESRVQRKRD